MNKWYMLAVAFCGISLASATLAANDDAESGTIDAPVDCTSIYDAATATLDGASFVVSADESERFFETTLFKCYHSGRDPSGVMGKWDYPTGSKATKSIENASPCGMNMGDRNGSFECSNADNKKLNLENLPGGLVNKNPELTNPMPTVVPTNGRLPEYPCGVALLVDRSRFSSLFDNTNIEPAGTTGQSSVEIATGIYEPDRNIDCRGGRYNLSGDKEYLITNSLPNPTLVRNSAILLSEGRPPPPQKNKPFLHLPAGTFLLVDPSTSGSNASTAIHFPTGGTFRHNNTNYTIDADTRVTVYGNNRVTSSRPLLPAEGSSVSTLNGVDLPARLEPYGSVSTRPNSWLPIKAGSMTTPPRPGSIL